MWKRIVVKGNRVIRWTVVSWSVTTQQPWPGSMKFEIAKVKFMHTVANGKCQLYTNISRCDNQNWNRPKSREKEFTCKVNESGSAKVGRPRFGIKSQNLWQEKLKFQVTKIWRIVRRTFRRIVKCTRNPNNNTSKQYNTGMRNPSSNGENKTWCIMVIFVISVSFPSKRTERHIRDTPKSQNLG